MLGLVTSVADKNCGKRRLIKEAMAKMDFMVSYFEGS
jgi:hypothetical protein